MSTTFAVVLGMVYNFIPFMILQIHTSLTKMDKSYLEAAAGSGRQPGAELPAHHPAAEPARCSQRHHPLVLLPAVSGFFIPKLLGGGQYVLIGNVIETQFLTSGDWNFGGAVWLIVAVIIMMYVCYRQGEHDPGCPRKGGLSI